jgi:putative membrane protein (TIGR04086 family)
MQNMRLIFFKKIFFALLIGAITCGVLLLAFSAVLSRQDDPSKLLNVFSLVSLLVGAFVCGKVSTLGLEEKALQGLFSGVGFVLLVLLPSVLLSDFGASSLLKMLATVLLAFVGAMLGGNGTNRVRSSKKRKSVVKRYAR